MSEAPEHTPEAAAPAAPADEREAERSDLRHQANKGARRRYTR